MFRDRDPLGRRNPFLTLLYVILIIILFGCIYFLITYTQGQREAYQNKKEELIAQETGDFFSTDEETVSTAEETAETFSEESQEETETEETKETELEETSGREEQTTKNQDEVNLNEMSTQIGKEQSQETKSNDFTGNDSKQAIPVSVGKYAASQLNILVLNGSGVSGTAAQWKERLEKFGYIHVIYGSYKKEITEVTQIFAEDKEKAKLMEKLFIEPHIEEGTVDESDYQVNIDEMSEAEKSILDKVEVWIVIGSDDVQNN